MNPYGALQEATIKQGERMFNAYRATCRAEARAAPR